MSNMEKVKEMLQNDPGTMEKFMEEIQRIAQGGEAADAKECTIKAVKSILDIDLTGEDLKAFETKPGEISLEDGRIAFTAEADDALLSRAAKAEARITRPDGTQETVALEQAGARTFAGAADTSAAGAYAVHVWCMTAAPYAPGAVSMTCARRTGTCWKN